MRDIKPTNKLENILNKTGTGVKTLPVAVANSLTKISRRSGCPPGYPLSPVLKPAVLRLHNPEDRVPSINHLDLDKREGVQHTSSSPVPGRGRLDDRSKFWTIPGVVNREVQQTISLTGAADSGHIRSEQDQPITSSSLKNPHLVQTSIHFSNWNSWRNTKNQ